MTLAIEIEKRPSSHFNDAIKEAVALNQRKNQLFDDLIKKIKVPESKHSPNHGITSVGIAFLFSGYKLSGQIIDSVRIGHLLIAVVASRPLFELMVNTNYIFNHPKHKCSARHMRRVCKDIIRLTNRKRNVNHSRIDGKSLKDRLKEIGQHKFYQTSYRGLSDWSHIMIRTPYISKQSDGEKFGIQIMVQTLCYAHDILDGACEGFQHAMDMGWEKDLVAYRDKYK